MVKEHPPTEKEIRDMINSQKGLSPEQKEILIRKSDETWFRQYVKNSNIHLKKLTKTVKKQIKYYYNKKGEREDKRGVEPPKQKGTTRPQLDKKLKEEKQKPIKNKVRKAREQTAKIYQRAPSGREYTYTEIHEGKGSKRAYAERERLGIPKNDFYNRKGETTYEKKP